MTTVNLLNTLVLEIAKSANINQDHATLNALGLDNKTLEAIHNLNDIELAFIQRNCISIVNVQIDVDTLQKASARANRDFQYQQMLVEAILFGATRQIMRDYVSISYRQFNDMKKSLSCHSEVSHAALSYEEITKLNQTIEEALANNKPPIHVRLPYLIQLAKDTNISINKIRSHLIEYWSQYHEF